MSNTNDKQFQTQAQNIFSPLLLVVFICHFFTIYFDICTAPMMMLMMTIMGSGPEPIIVIIIIIIIQNL